jgi:hypothetical protein
MFPLLLLLFAATSRVELIDEVVEIPAAEWRYVELNLKQEPVTVICHFDTVAGSGIRVALLRREDLARLREDRAHGLIAVTPPGQRGRLRHTVHEPGPYYVVVDNRERGEQAAKVRLRVSLDFSPAAEPLVRELSPARRAAVIAISFAVFFAIVLFTGRRLFYGLRR